MNTTYYMNLVASNVYRAGTPPEHAIPYPMYVGLSSTAPNANGGNFTEPSASAGYARTELSNLSDPTGGVVHNKYAISFAESTANWGAPIAYYGIFDSQIGGKLCIYGALTNSKIVEADSVMTLNPGAITLKVCNE